MADQPKAVAGDDFGPRVAIFYAAIFAFVGVQMPFFPVWLAAKGLDPRSIALVLSLAITMRLFAVPIATRLVDRSGRFRGALIFASAATSLGYVALGFAEGLSGILALYAVASVFAAPVLPLADAYALKGLRVRGRPYGPVRLWGSAAFVAANLGAGLLLDLIAPRQVLWLLVAALLATAAASLGLRPLDADPPRPAGAGTAHRRLLLSPVFLTVVAASSLIQASHALFYGFSVIDWTRKGLSGSVIGGLWAIGVLAEIALFALSGRLPPQIGPLALIGLGALGAVVRWSIMATDPPWLLLPLLQCLHGLSFGATFLGSVQMIARIAADRQPATAQGDFATVGAAAMAVSTAFSGVLYGAQGSAGYVVMAVIAAAGGGFVLLASLLSRD